MTSRGRRGDGGPSHGDRENRTPNEELGTIKR
jgi:hypothetical protein